jgi:hypothetical protein
MFLLPIMGKKVSMNLIVERIRIDCESASEEDHIWFTLLDSHGDGEKIFYYYISTAKSIAFVIRKIENIFRLESR